MNALILELKYNKFYIAIKGIILNNILYDFENKEALIGKPTLEKYGFHFDAFVSSILYQIRPNSTKEFTFEIDGAYEIFDKGFGTDFFNVFTLEQNKIYLIKVVKE